MAKKWRDKDSARMMTNKYNEAVDELNEVTQSTKTFNRKVDEKLTSVESELDFNSEVPSPNSSLIRIKGTIPQHPYEYCIENNSSICGKYAVIGASIVFNDGTTKLVDDSFDIYTKEDGLYMKVASWEQYKNLNLVVLLVEIPEDETVDPEIPEETGDDKEVTEYE